MKLKKIKYPVLGIPEYIFSLDQSDVNVLLTGLKRLPKNDYCVKELTSILKNIAKEIPYGHNNT